MSGNNQNDEMREINHPPDAASLMESMRSIGYSLDAALADLIDNSITAGASEVRMNFCAEGERYVVLWDNGLGMSDAELQAAMRHGSRNPLEVRARGDLGRYGLGLKTASLSQCRKLTVISLRDGELSAYMWDLGTVAVRGAWTMLGLDRDEISKLPHIAEFTAAGRGTIVVWQDLDRLVAGESDPAEALAEKMDAARNHLSLIFHRYLTGEPGIGRLRLSINDRPLEPIDPFLSGHRGGQRLDEDKFFVEGERVTVKPFILPHISKLTRQEIGFAGGEEGMRHNQGFYIYRNCRLIIWGTWFRLGKKDELSKLARVRVDIPNSLDHLWTLDVKKSAAAPPEAVRANLRRTVQRIKDYSGQTIQFRGRVADPKKITAAWHEVLDRDGVRYDINRNHPSITQLRALIPNHGPALEALLRIIEISFPANALYAHMASEMRPAFDSELVESELVELARVLLNGLEGSSALRKRLLDTLHLIEPFNAYPEVAKKIAADLEKNDQ